MTEDLALAVAGLSIACLALGLWLAPQRHRMGLAFGVLGLAGISLAIVWRTYLGPHVVSLKAEMVRLNDLIAAKNGEAQILADRLRGQDAHIATLTQQTTLLVDNSRRLENELAKTKAARIDRLRQMMRQGFTTPTYYLQAITETELVTDLKGSYFVIRLREPATGSLFIFREREFALDAQVAALRESGIRVGADFISELEGVGRFECFVRGGADARPFTAVESAPRLGPVSYLPLGGDGKYTLERREQLPTGSISNDDLPNLRAAYFQLILGPVLPCKTIMVLANGPAATVEPSARTVELLLFVVW